MKLLQNMLLDEGFKFQSRTAWYGKRTRSICFSRFKEGTTIIGIVNFNRTTDIASLKLSMGVMDEFDVKELDNLTTSSAIARIKEVALENNLANV